MDKEFKCKYCDKSYSSQSARCNHIKIKHNNKSILKCIPNVKNVKKCIPKNAYEKKSELNIEVLICKYCNNKYSSRQNRWKHESKTCKQKKINK